MYICTDCDFESEEIRDPATLKYLFIGDKCRSCYYSTWANDLPVSKFNCTASEQKHYDTVNYDPSRVQDVLLNSFTSHR